MNYDGSAPSPNEIVRAEAFVKKINAHKNRRIQAENAAAVLTLTAKMCRRDRYSEEGDILNYSTHFKMRNYLTTIPVSYTHL